MDISSGNGIVALAALALFFLFPLPILLKWRKKKDKKDE